MRKTAILLVIFLFTALLNARSVHDFTATDIDGQKASLSKFKGKVMLIVNTASECGFTSQYEGLQKIYEKYRDKGLVVLAFPANDFMNQEPLENKDIKEFCQVNYGVTFPVFSKIHVKGPAIHPLYRYLTSESANHKHGGDIGWNFVKFLVGRNGDVIDRFSSITKPGSSSITEAIESALKKK